MSKHHGESRFLDDGENLRLASTVKSAPALTRNREAARTKLMGALETGDHVNPSRVYNYLEPHGA